MNIWIISKIYKNILHIIIWDTFNIDLSATFQTRSRSPF